MNVTFPDSPEYRGPGCFGDSYKDENDIGNQPVVSDADSTEVIRSQSIPNYPGNCASKGSNY